MNDPDLPGMVRYAVPRTALCEGGQLAGVSWPA
jgi:hypothetical protein